MLVLRTSFLARSSILKVAQNIETPLTRKLLVLMLLLINLTYNSFSRPWFPWFLQILISCSSIHSSYVSIYRTWYYKFTINIFMILPTTSSRGLQAKPERTEYVRHCDRCMDPLVSESGYACILDSAAKEMVCRIFFKYIIQWHLIMNATSFYISTNI